jgi:hypothetical protein
MTRRIQAQDIIDEWERRNWRKRDSWTAAQGDALPAGASWERREATRTPTLSGDVAVPLAQALVCGVAGGIVGGLLGDLRSGAVVGALAFVVAWGALIADTRSLLRTVEKITRKDLDGDSYVGEPPVVRAEIVEKDASGNVKAIRWLDLPGDEETIRQFARAVIAGRSLAESQWTGSGKPFSRDEYREMRDSFIEKGMARWRNLHAPAQGWELTKKGEAVMRQLANPLPHGGE